MKNQSLSKFPRYIFVLDKMTFKHQQAWDMIECFYGSRGKFDEDKPDYKIPHKVWHDM
jgi:hypothetical protein